MDWSTYMRRAAEFRVYPPERESEYLALKLVSELGEVAGKIAKRMRGDEVTDDMILDEIGDCLWYLAMIARRWDWTTIDNIQRHIADDTDHPEFYAFNSLIYAVDVSGALLRGRDPEYLEREFGTGDLVGMCLRYTCSWLDRLAQCYDSSLGELKTRNIEKLEGRRAAGTIRGSGDDR